MRVTSKNQTKYAKRVLCGNWHEKYVLSTELERIDLNNNDGKIKKKML